MKIIEPSFSIIDFPDNALEKIERAGRICYQSESKGLPEEFVRKLISLGHHTPLEMASVTVEIICDRGVMAELTRHRLASFNIESTRYVNYSKKNIEFIKPSFWNENSDEYSIWLYAMEECEKAYIELLRIGASPQQARSVLPNSLKTNIIMSCNLRELRHILDLRCNSKAHPQIREICLPLLKEVYSRCPAVFRDIYQKYNQVS